jgi:hypothetical protein
MINRLQRKIAKIALQQLDGIVYQHIKKHPGQRCFEIDDATLNSHHQWGTKHILQRLEQQGKIYCVKREFVGTMTRPGEQPEVVWKKVPPTYFTYTN